MYIREGVKKKPDLFGTLPQSSDPTHPPRTFGTPLSEKWKLSLFCFLGCLEHFIFLKKWAIFRTKFHVFIWDSGPPPTPTATPFLGRSPKKTGFYWMVIFTKKFGTLDPHLPIVWDKVPKKTFFWHLPEAQTWQKHKNTKILRQSHIDTNKLWPHRFCLCSRQPRHIFVPLWHKTPPCGNHLKVAMIYDDKTLLISWGDAWVEKLNQ